MKKIFLLTAGLVLATGLFFPGSVMGQEPVQRRWGLGWDHGLTLRGWLSGRWEFSVAAGPNDYLNKSEVRNWRFLDPPTVQGVLEVPDDVREEHGWVRAQAGRLIRKQGDFALVGYLGLAYEWAVFQERSLVLQDLSNDYATTELDRHTRRWIMTAGFRPSWQVTSLLTLETSFGLDFMVENWDQDRGETFAGQQGVNREQTSGHGEFFRDFGIDGSASIQLFFWF